MQKKKNRLELGSFKFQISVVSVQLSDQLSSENLVLQVIYQTRGRVFRPISKHLEVFFFFVFSFPNCEVFGNRTKHYFRVFDITSRVYQIL